MLKTPAKQQLPVGGVDEVETLEHVVGPPNRTSASALLLRGVVLRLRADLRWLAACARLSRTFRSDYRCRRPGAEASVRARAYWGCESGPQRRY